MNSFKYILIIKLTLIGLLSFGQSIEGIVIDAETEEGISYSNIYIKELHIGTRADSLGHFQFSHLTTKTLTFHISAVGFLSKILEINIGEFEEELIIKLEPNHIELTEVIVSTPTGKLTNENIVLVQKENMADLNKNAHNSVMESISQIAGVDQISTGTAIGKPVIRGLTGNRVVTYAQGIRIENQQWGAEHGLGIGDIGISGIEVIKGPNSLLYGSDAIGGVLYFTDESYAKSNSVEGSLQSTYLNNALALQNSLGIKVHRGKYKQNFFAAFNTSSDYKVPSGTRVVNTRYDEKNIKTSLGYNNKFWVTNFRYSYLENNFGITDSDSLYHSSSDKKTALPFQNVADHKLSSENVFFINKSKVELTLGYVSNRRKEFEDSKEIAALDMLLSTSTYNFKFHFPIQNEKHSIIVGAQGMYQSNTNSGEEVLIPDAVIIDNGIYGLWLGTFEKLSLQAGLRADQRNLNGLETSFGQNDVIESLQRRYSSLNYSAGLLYKNGINAFRISFSSGFRAPNTSELLSMGEHEGTNRYEIGDKDLKSENANQIDVSYIFKSEHLEFSINPFYNAVQNYIYLNPTDSIIEGSQVYNYSQNDVKLFGGEAGLHFHPHIIHWLHFETVYSSVTGIDSEDKSLALMPANNLNTTLKAEFKAKRKFNLSELFLQHQYKFEQNNTAINETPSAQYHIFNFGIVAELKNDNRSLKFKSGINNIFNATFIDHLSRLKAFAVPGQGRNVYLSVNLSF